MAVAFVAHCLLDPDAKVRGVPRHRGILSPVVSLLERHGIGLVQMPCEVVHLGLGRPLGTDTVEQYDTPAYREVCRDLAESVARQIAAYRTAGIAVPFVLGVEGSPSCSVSAAPRLVAGRRRPVRGAPTSCATTTPSRTSATPRWPRLAWTASSPSAGRRPWTRPSALSRAGVDVPVVGLPESEDAGNLDEALSRLEQILAEG